MLSPKLYYVFSTLNIPLKGDHIQNFPKVDSSEKRTPHNFLYNTVHYYTVLYITQFKDGSQKGIKYIEKKDHKWSFFYIIIYTFLFGYNKIV